MENVLSNCFNKKLDEKNSKKPTQWEKFLNSLFTQLSSYEIQENPEKYNVKNMAFWEQEGKPQGLVITEVNFKKFQNKVRKYRLMGHREFMNITEPSKSQLDDLNRIVNLTLKQKMVIKCTQKEILITGSYVSLKNVMNQKNTILRCPPDNREKATHVKVFALNTIFIDADVNQSMLPFTQKMLPLIFIAPTWEVIDSRHINLLGVDGDHTKANRIGMRLLLKTSKDGKPGLPGEPGGLFFGIGDRFINGDKLTIAANGGNGGTGQDGTNGENGRDGKPPLLRSCPGFCENGMNNGLACLEICQYYVRKRWEFLPIDNSYSRMVYSCGISRAGEEGTQGEDGGNGGAGGKGGFPGNVTLVELDQNSSIVMQLKRGKDGMGGKGAIGGIGGMEQSPLIGYCRKRVVLDDTPSFNLTGDDVDRALPGKNGTDGANFLKLELPKIADYDFALDKIVNEYKYFLRENLSNSFNKTAGIEFLNKIEGSEKVRNVYDTLGLVDDLKKMEIQIYYLQKNINFNSLYQSLMNRTTEHAKKLKDYENSWQYKKILKHLYMATLSSKNNMNESSESAFIIDTIHYLEDLKKNFIDLINKKIAKNIFLDKINIYSEEYKNHFVEKSIQAQNLIDNEIANELETINYDINKSIAAALNETETLKMEADKKRDELRNSKVKLKNVLFSKWVSTIVKTSCTIASFFGPVSAVVGLAIGVPYSVIESATSDNDKKISEVGKNILTGVKSMKSAMSELMEAKITNFKHLLDDFSKKIKGRPDFEELSTYMDEAKKKLDGLKKNKFNIMKIRDMEKDLKSKLEGEFQKFPKGDQGSQAYKTLDFVEKGAQVGIELSELYMSYKDYASKMDSLAESIKENENNFDELKEIENGIYINIIPTLQELFDNVENIQSNSFSKSTVNLDFFQYQVQNVMSKTKKFVETKMGELDIKDNLLSCLEKLERLIPILINKNTQIQEFKEQEYLADFTSNINSAAVDDISGMDNKLIAIVEELDTHVYSNIVVQRYKTGIKAFQQFVFPFAKDYLKNLKLPRQLRLKENITDLVDDIEEEVGEILLKLNMYRSLVKKPFDKLQHGDFNSRSKSLEPFFVWENEEHKYAIERLLSGQEVLLNADISKALPYFSAVKFNSIELDFIIRNKSSQKNLVKILEYFEVILTHLGDSYYIYNNKTYLIQTNSVHMSYYYEKKPNGDRVRHSETYDLIKNGDYMLSPYALWRVKLESVPKKDNNVTFADLKEFKDEVRIELSGTGRYVKTSDLQEDDYYESVHTCDFIFPKENHFPVQKQDINGGSNVLERPQTASVNWEEKEDMYSWLKNFPILNILPGAEAVVHKGSSVRENFFMLNHSSFSKNLKADDSFDTASEILETIFKTSSSFIINVKILSNFISEKMANFFTNFFYQYDNFNTSNELSANDYSNQNFKENRNETVLHPICTDVKDYDHSFTGFNHNNLLFAQYILSQKFKTNKTLCQHYLSPEFERQMKVNNLSQKILPELKKVSQFHKAKIFLNHYDNGPEWYREIFKEDVEKLHKANSDIEVIF